MSIQYYNDHSDKFIKETFNADMLSIVERFLVHIPDKGAILDLGCGSGRDSGYFVARGYEVYGIDGSEKMIEHARRILGDRAVLTTFDAYSSDKLFDGIWASASLLHVPYEELPDIISKYRDMLGVGGVFYMSFKNRERDYEKDGRYFTCFDEKRLLELLMQLDGLKVMQVFETADVRKNRGDQLWVNCLCMRI